MVEPLVWFAGGAAVASLAIAALVFRAAPGRRRNRLLALALLFAAILHAQVATFNVLLTEVATDASTMVGVNSILWYAIWGLALSYLAFLGTIDTPWSRPLESNTALVGLGALLAGAWILRLVAPGATRPFSDLSSGDTWTVLTIVIGAAGLYGLLVAFSYYRDSEVGTLRRRQAKAYLAAFGSRDLAYLALGGLAIGAEVLAGNFDLANPAWFPIVGELLFAPLAAYGILTTQLFDIDLKIKWTLEKSTVAAIFIAVFFIVSEGAQALFADFAGNELIGVLAAGLLVFFLAPLQRFADKVSDQAMPGVEDTAEYREQRKREVYRASVEELHADEQITPKERRMLGRLQEELGLEGGEASRIEADVVDAGGGS